MRPGQAITVTASNFRGTYVNSLNIGWTKTVLGTETTEVDWGPPIEKRTVGTQSFEPTNLKPATTYNFRVRECDGLTCAPWSDIFQTATEPAGATQVRFWLDSNSPQIIGSSAVAPTGGSFYANVTIPGGTMPGPHTINASQGTLQASAPITVCAAGGCGPTLAVVNTSNNTLYPPGAIVVVSEPVTVRGSRFAPGGLVTMFVDAMSGAKVCTAQVGPLGNCQCTSSMPRVGAGPHKFLAVEGSAGPVMRQLRPRPPGQAYTPGLRASVAVYVQAMAQ